MLIRDLFRLSFHNLFLHKIRSFLTSLGIIFGVGSVISMLAISEGAKRQALAQIEALGIDKIIVYSKQVPQAGKDVSDSSNQSMVKSYGLSLKDFKHIAEMDNVAAISTVRDTRKKILRGTKRLDVILVAVSPAFLKDSASAIVSGRWLTPADESNASSVCVIGRNVKRKLFSLGETVLNGRIKVENAVFKVVGIMENNLGTQFPELNSPNDMIVIPQRTSESFFGYSNFEREGRAKLEITNIEADLFIVKVSDLAYIDDTAKRIASFLEKSHPRDKDWGLTVPLDLLKQREQTQNIFTIVMSSIAGISLIVGGVGIMNIMLANVYERRKEIGTRRALGAKKKDILFQFLIETVFLTTLGGMIGITLGIAISEVVTKYAEWPTIYSVWSIAISIFIACFVGIVFGTYPAWKAAQQNPIDVLRSE